MAAIILTLHLTGLTPLTSPLSNDRSLRCQFKQFDLHIEGHIANFIQEKRPPANSNRPFREETAPVKAPFSCPNNSLSSTLQNSTTVYRYEGSRFSTGQVMNQFCGDLLSQFLTTLNQNRRTCLGDLRYKIADTFLSRG